MMEKRLPGVPIPVSPVSLGAAQFGDSLGEKESCALLDVYTERGGNLLDTANCYGRWLPHGENVSEQILGRWLKQHGNRNGLVISTKGGHPPFDAMTASRLHEKELRYDLESSLRALGTDHVDLYWLHRDDPTLPVEELLGLLEQFRREGKLLSYGVSNWTTERVRQAAKAAAAHGYAGFCGVQNQWSLARADHDKLVDPTLVCMDQPLYDLLKEHPDTLCTMAFSAMGRDISPRRPPERCGMGLSGSTAVRSTIAVWMLCGRFPARTAFRLPPLFWHGWPESLSPPCPSRLFPV